MEFKQFKAKFEAQWEADDLAAASKEDLLKQLDELDAE